MRGSVKSGGLNPAFQTFRRAQANSSPLVYARRQNAELNNGRLAMIAVALLVIKEKITGLAVAGDFEGSELKAIGQLGAEIAGSQ